MFELHCDGTTAVSSSMASKTWANSNTDRAGLPIAETVGLVLPGDGRYGDRGPICATPAPVIVRGERDIVVWAVEDATIATLNAASPQI